jgi:hypothetical protein
MAGELSFTNVNLWLKYEDDEENRRFGGEELLIRC